MTDFCNDFDVDTVDTGNSGGSDMLVAGIIDSDSGYVAVISDRICLQTMSVMTKR
jgi:hypothetical protein